MAVKVVMVSKACYRAAYRSKLEELARLGVELTLVVPPYWRLGKRRHFIEVSEARRYRVLVENPTLNGHFHLHFYPQLPRILRRIRPDLLHIDEEPYDLVTFHALLAAGRVGAQALFFAWQNLPRRLPPPFSLFQGYVFSRCRGAIAGSLGAGRLLRERGFSKPLFIIPQFGVDADLFRPEGRKEGSGPFVIGYAGRLVEEKGLLVLLEAVAGLEGDWRLELVGEGPLASALKVRAQGLGIAGRVALRGALPSMEMPRFYPGLDVLVLPSLTRRGWMEQFGRVAAEAMACAVPVVGSDSGAIPEVIGDAGIIVPEGDVLALRKQLTRLKGDLALRRELSERGRQRVLDRFTQAQVAEQTYQIYEMLLKA